MSGLERCATPTYCAPAFDPAVHGFRFANAFDHSRYVAPAPHAWRLVIHGRAGGMVYAALDFWLEGEPVPPEPELPPDGDIVADYLAARQRDAFAGVAAELVTAAQVDGVLAGLDAAARDRRGATLDALRRSLEAGRPCPLGLVPPREQAHEDAAGRGHQVLAIGFGLPAEGAPQIHVYDPDHPRQVLVLRRRDDASRWDLCRLELDDRGQPWLRRTGAAYGAWFLDRGYVGQRPRLLDARPELVDLSHRDLRGWDPPGQDLQSHRLVGADLRGHGGLDRRDLQGVDARGARLDGASLRDCDLRSCDLRTASLVGCDLSGSTLDRAQLRGADLREATLHRSALRRVYAVAPLRADGVQLVDAHLDEAVLEGASLEEARIVGSHLPRARLDRARLRRAEVVGGRFVDCSAPAARFDEATLRGTSFEGGSDLRGARFDGARLRQCSFVGADLRDASFAGATLEEVDLSFADLRGADLCGARLRAVHLMSVSAEGSRWEGARLHEARLTHDLLVRLRAQGVAVSVEQLALRTARAQIGGVATRLFGGRYGLFASREGTGDLWRWDGRPHAWTQLAARSEGVAVTDDGLFALPPGRWRVRWHREHEGWQTIGGPATRLHGGGHGLFVETSPSRELYRWEGQPDRWTWVSEPAAAFAVTDDELFRITRDGNAVERHRGDGSWERIGGAATELHAGGLGLLATRPERGDLWRWEGQPEQWSHACEPSASIAVADDELYRLTPARDVVQRVLGGVELPVGGPAEAIVAAGAKLFALSHRGREIWRLV